MCYKNNNDNGNKDSAVSINTNNDINENKVTSLTPTIICWFVKADDNET